MDQGDETGRLLAAIGSLVPLAEPSYAAAVLREAAHSLVAGKGGRVAKGRASPDQVHTWRTLRAELRDVVEEKELSVATVAEQLGLSVSVVRAMLRRHGGTPSDEAPTSGGNVVVATVCRKDTGRREGRQAPCPRREPVTGLRVVRGTARKVGGLSRVSPTKSFANCLGLTGWCWRTPLPGGASHRRLSRGYDRS